MKEGSWIYFFLVSEFSNSSSGMYCEKSIHIKIYWKVSKLERNFPGRKVDTRAFSDREKTLSCRVIYFLNSAAKKKCRAINSVHNCVAIPYLSFHSRYVISNGAKGLKSFYNRILMVKIKFISFNFQVWLFQISSPSVLYPSGS